jgi:hypothetical protein
MSGCQGVAKLILLMYISNRQVVQHKTKQNLLALALVGKPNVLHHGELRAKGFFAFRTSGRGLTQQWPEIGCTHIDNPARKTNWWV